MKYIVTLNEQEMMALLDIIKYDCNEAYANAEAKNMQDDIALLEALSHSFKNENAKLMLQTIISDYKSKLRGIL